MRQFFATIMVAIALLAGPPASAQTFPKLTGRVVDEANLLDPAQEAALSAKLESFETQTQRQFVVATVPDLQGYDIRDYGYRLGRDWAIGDKERNDGLLLVVAPNERKVAFEVGYGLEAYMPDALAHRIIQDEILPRFRSDDYPGGIDAGANAAITQLQLPPEEAAKVAATAAQTSRDKGNDGDGAFVVIWIFIILFFVVIPILSSVFGGGKKRRRGRGYSGPVIIWGGSDWGGGSSSSSWGGGGSSWGGGGFSGGGGGFGGGGASGGW